MLEEKIDALTAAINKLNANLEKGGTAGAATGGKAAPKPAGKPKPKYTADQVKSAVMEVKDTIGAAAATALITSVGDGAVKLAELIQKPECFDAAVEAAQAALTEFAEANPAEEDI